MQGLPKGFVAVFRLDEDGKERRYPGEAPLNRSNMQGLIDLVRVLNEDSAGPIFYLRAFRFGKLDGTIIPELTQEVAVPLPLRRNYQ